ncbi:uncharacterized protein LOC127096060 [Lathyrus oleraceus]|uniref:uncharacterized protein LOC127096060 n=1 Tax=Pisum sativum TaxID=3888 RepID=UPI0021CF69CD|nr:uncharacterized protein LOC127096060 [Pisum sativum]
MKLEDQVDVEVERRLKTMNIGTQQVAQVQPVQAVNCEIFGGPRFFIQCVATAQQIEEIKFLKQNNPYSNTYNPSRKNHPNFSWKDQQGNVQKQDGPDNTITHNQAQGTLPSATIQNSRHHENVNVVTTRSQKFAKDEEDKATKYDHYIEVDLEVRENKKEEEEVIPPVKPIEEKKSNIPFFEALEQIPVYTKFMKEVIVKKRPIGDGSTTLNEKGSEISPGRRIPNNQKDPGDVTVPCTIKDITFKKVVIDSGASVSLMPLSIYQRLGIGNISDTRTNLKFADHSIKNAYGITEDVLVTIEEFSFLVDFVIIDIPEDEETPIILGRSFLRASRCNFDIDHGTLTLKVYDDEITLNVIENMKLEVEKEYHYQVQTNLQVRSDAETKENRDKSEKFSHAPVGLLRPPVAPTTGRSRDVRNKSQNP